MVFNIKADTNFPKKRTKDRTLTFSLYKLHFSLCKFQIQRSMIVDTLLSLRFLGVFKFLSLSLSLSLISSFKFLSF